MKTDSKATTSEVTTTARSPKCNAGAVIQRDAGAVVKPPFPSMSSTHKTKRAQCLLETLSETHAPCRVSWGHFGKRNAPLFPRLAGKKPFKTRGEIMSGHGSLLSAPQSCLPPRRPCTVTAAARLLQAVVSPNQGRVCSKQRCTSMPKL